MHKNQNSDLDIFELFPLIICDSIACPLYNFITVRDISKKLHTRVKYIQTTCHAQDPERCFGYFWSHFPLIICDSTSCPLYNLITVRDISTKLHTLVKHIQTTCHANEPELCFVYFWSYCPLIICNAILCPRYNLITVRDISTKLHVFVKHMSCTRIITPGNACLFSNLVPL